MKKFEGLEFLTSENEIDFYKFKPSLFKHYFMDFPKDQWPNYFSTVRHHLRMMVELIRAGYEVIYLCNSSDIVVVSKGGGKIKCSSVDDIIIGPIWTCPKYRSKRYASLGINMIINKLGYKFNYAWEFIDINNTPSIRTVEKNNFEKVGFGRETKIFSDIILADTGTVYIYRNKGRGR